MHQKVTIVCRQFSLQIRTRGSLPASLQLVEHHLRTSVRGADIQSALQELSRLFVPPATNEQFRQGGVGGQVIGIERQGVAEMADGLLIAAQLHTGIAEI